MFALQFHDGSRFTATGSLRMLIQTAYRLQEFQLIGGPDWIDSDRFDILAQADRESTRDETLSMLRELLAERFRLRVRTELRELPVYVLSLGGGAAARGPQLSRTVTDCDTPSPATSRDGPAGCRVRFAPGRLEAVGLTMPALASNLSMWVDRVVTDGTGLEGRFDLQLRWMPDRLPQAPTSLSTPDISTFGAAEPDAPSLFTALREQLGLRLDPQRGPAEVVVVERAERPTPD